MSHQGDLWKQNKTHDILSQVWDAWHQRPWQMDQQGGEQPPLLPGWSITITTEHITLTSRLVDYQLLLKQYT